MVAVLCGKWNLKLTLTTKDVDSRGNRLQMSCPNTTYVLLQMTNLKSSWILFISCNVLDDLGWLVMLPRCGFHVTTKVTCSISLENQLLLLLDLSVRIELPDETSNIQSIYHNTFATWNWHQGKSTHHSTLWATRWFPATRTICELTWASQLC